MKAGRELDALIAEKVMELEVIPSECVGSGWWGEGQRIFFRPSNDQICVIAPDGGAVNYDIPHYSTQIADAWLVVEKLQEAIFSLEWEKGWKDNAWHIYIRKHENDEQITAFADTAPLAICLAALKTVEDKS